MDPHLVRYVFRYYSHFMTTNERLANRHFLAAAKTTHGRTDLAAQEEARNSRSHLRNLLSDDPEVLELTRDGAESFLQRTAERITRSEERIWLGAALPFPSV
jgi:CBS-domain-containing membrane protein